MRVLLIVLLTTWTSLAMAAPSVKTNNQMMKDCLTTAGYDYTAPVEERLNTTNWNEIAACSGGFIYQQHQQYLAQQQQFLKENPWYKGKNWRWELRAEYTCRIIHSDVGPREVCSKPAYVQ